MAERIFIRRAGRATPQPGPRGRHLSRGRLYLRRQRRPDRGALDRGASRRQVHHRQGCVRDGHARRGRYHRLLVRQPEAGPVGVPRHRMETREGKATGISKIERAGVPPESASGIEMRKRVTAALLATFALAMFAPSAVAAPISESAWSRCAAIQDDGKRLSCFDGRAGPALRAQPKKQEDPNAVLNDVTRRYEVHMKPTAAR